MTGKVSDILFAAQRRSAYWCGLGNEWYAPREVQTRLKQAGGKVVGLNFKQSETVLVPGLL